MILSQKINKIFPFIGAGESGKSTILKQMKLIHSEGYTQDEKIMFKEAIFSNILDAMRSLIDALGTLNIPLGNPDNGKYIEAIKTAGCLVDEPDFPQELVTAIKALWNDEGVKQCYQRANEFQIIDSAK